MARDAEPIEQQVAADDPIRLSVTVSPELNNRLEEIAQITHSTKSEVLRKAITLIDVAVRAEREGNKLYISPTAPASLSREIVGIF